MVSRHHSKLIIALFILLFLVVVLRSAWLCDDAYITFRTVDNFINGYGLTWNPVERVQAYTHPLWMFLIAVFYFFTREIYYTSIILSLTISLVAVILFAFRVAPSLVMALLGLAILTASKAFVDYSTSGLENPLTHLLWVIFLLIYLRSEVNLKAVFLLSFIAGLATLNRMDTLLLYLPALVYVLVKFGRLKGVYALILGFLPFILWELFSLFYYGFPFPNTAYAKLNVGISGWELAERGLQYLMDSLTMDPLTLLIIAVGMLIPFISREWRVTPIVAGMALYLLYIIRIGGDFMSGRYLTVLLLGAVILLADNRFVARKTVWVPAFIVVILVGLVAPHSPVLSGSDYGLNHETLDAAVVEDERAHYYHASGFFSSAKGKASLDHSWADKGKEARLNGPSVVVKGAIGYFSYYAGPDVYVVNIYALGDPLLARLPPKFRKRWVIGHFSRAIPDGYLETLESGHNVIRDENLASYYDQLALIVRGKLLDVDRLVTIWDLNLGRYDYLIESYPPMFEINPTRIDREHRISWNSEDNLEQYAGIQINLNGKSHAGLAEFVLAPYENGASEENQSREYYLLYFNEDLRVATQELAVPSNIETVSVRVVPIPEEAAEKGYDMVRIIPKEDDYISSSVYNVGSMTFVE
jgi:arabinofuranosyltransferase